MQNLLPMSMLPPSHHYPALGAQIDIRKVEESDLYVVARAFLTKFWIKPVEHGHDGRMETPNTVREKTVRRGKHKEGPWWRCSGGEGQELDKVATPSEP